jgi:hypothetical protein
VNKFELMATMMGGGAVAPVQDAEGTVRQSEAGALAYYSQNDLAVQLGVVKPGAMILPSTAVQGALADPSVHSSAALRNKLSLRQAVRKLMQQSEECRYCGAARLTWLMEESGRWRLYGADGEPHFCRSVMMPFKPLAQLPEEK